MSNFPLPQLPPFLKPLFAAPVTSPYPELTLLLLGVATSLVFSPNALPVLAKYLLLLVTIGWVARLGDSAAQRWGWLGGVGLFILGRWVEGGACLLR